MTRDAPRSAVVTGAGSGIGLAIARLLAERGWRVFPTVRKRQDAARLAGALGPAAHPLIFDLRDRPAMEAAAAEVAGVLDGRPLGGLVSNAGIGIPGPILHQPFEELREQVETNLLGALSLIQSFGPLLIDRAGPQRRSGRIVTMSSVGGLQGQPFASAYCATKHALEGLSESLRRELRLDGIAVIVVAPSLVATPAWDKAEAQGPLRFAATRYGASFEKAMRGMIDRGRRRSLPPEAVARTVFAALTARRPAARYAPARNRLLEQAAVRLLPRRLIDRILARRLGLDP